MLAVFLFFKVMRKQLTLFLCVVAINACSADNRAVEVTALLESGKILSAIEVVSIDECSTENEACAFLGVGLLKFGGSEHIELAKRYIVAAANSGNLRAKVVLGNFKIEGSYFDKSPVEGIALLKEVASLGASEGKYYLAHQFYSGKHVKKDVKKALKLFTEASMLGHKYAHYNAGVLYYELYKDCQITEQFFARGAQFDEHAKVALEQIRAEPPCGKTQ
ncbi:tetratricopeptide repeat protein [Shewanella zhangzhouensis]|uniref:tetratricopeptide repeat protein n=1 Tax=Shewanella zhangzhouensis TaxID=2864213 RepID=UPI001C65639B|nr:hypothetical protein [Shewanella zhangzhouensis]QYK06869.1 hypothetical protein K0H63_08765 [Shewanella zhangzhouensis]